MKLIAELNLQATPIYISSSNGSSSESEDDRSDSGGNDSEPMGELSRPKQAIMSKVPKDVKGRGRKRKREATERVRVNWKHPLVFALIREAQVEVAYYDRSAAWSPVAITKRCQSKSFRIFKHLSSQVLGRWIDRSGPSPKWSAAVLADVQLNGNTPHTMSTRSAIFDSKPDLKKLVVDQLRSLRQTGVAVTIPTVHAVIIAFLQHHSPEMLENFKCSDSWVRKFVQNELQWCMRKPTKASQKVPIDAESQIELSFLRHVLTFRDAPIQHAAFRVNMDQTQVVYQMGGGLTFEVIGASQVPVLGLEEKRAFTLVVAVSGLGELLPFQAIFQGKTIQSLPKKNARGHAESDKLGFIFEYSGTGTYWSNLETMKTWVQKILVPYWRAKMVEFNIPSQECLLQLDVWSVHRSREFKGWMKLEYPWILLEFVPGGCTGIFQACDVGIQRTLKLSIKRYQQTDVIDEVRAQFQNGVSPSDVKFDLTLGCLRDRAVGWMVSAFHEINKPEIVLQVRYGCALPMTTNVYSQAFQLCKSGEFNLSHESITSPDAIRALREIQINDPIKWAKIALRNHDVVSTSEASSSDEPESPFDHVVEDDSAVTVPELVASIADGPLISCDVITAPEGHLELAEDSVQVTEEETQNAAVTSIEEILEKAVCGRGKRRQIKSRRYEHDFEAH